MEEYDALLCFLDGLQELHKMELRRLGVQDLASTIVVVESLIEFKRK